MSESKLDLGPLCSHDAREREDAPMSSLPIQSKSINRGRFQKRFGKKGAGGSRVADSFIHHRPIEDGAGWEKVSISKGRQEGGGNLMDCLSSLFLESMESDESFPRFDFDLVDDMSSCEDAPRIVEFEGEEVLLGRFFAPIVESIVVSDSEYED